MINKIFLTFIYSGIMLTLQADIAINQNQSQYPNLTDAIKCLTGNSSTPQNCQNIQLNGNFSCCYGYVKSDLINLKSCIYLPSSIQGDQGDYIKEELKIPKNSNVTIEVKCAKSLWNHVMKLTFLVFGLLLF